MPIYEYQCRRCGETLQALVMRIEEESGLKCPNCGTGDLKRLISRVSYHVSEADRLSNYNPKDQRSESFFRDSRNIGLHAKWRAKQMGVDLGSAFEEKLERVRTDPSSVIKDSD